MPFWSQNHTDNPQFNDPKRKFRFVVRIDGLQENTLWYAKTAQKPSFQIAAQEHKYLNHTFYYPGSVTWQEVTLTLVDPVDPDMAASFNDIIQAGGYHPPANPADLTTMTKASAASALGQVTVAQIDHEGNPLETWTLWNAFITELTFGDLEYGSDELTEISMKLRYDWAQLSTANPSERDGASASRTEFYNIGNPEVS